MISKQNLRSQCKYKRLNLSASEQAMAAEQLVTQITKSGFFNKAKHIAFYMDTSGEISTDLLLNYARKFAKSCYLPVIHPTKTQQLVFLPLTKATKLVHNKWQILEPDFNPELIFPWQQLDIICVPLVAFDDAKHRIGMGGGFYDNTLADIHHLEKRPLLIGLAHECQKVPHIPTKNWDLDLDVVVTPQRIYF